MKEIVCRNPDAKVNYHNKTISEMKDILKKCVPITDKNDISFIRKKYEESKQVMINLPKNDGCDTNDGRMTKYDCLRFILAFEDDNIIKNTESHKI